MNIDYKELTLASNRRIEQPEALRLAKYVARRKLAKQLDVNEIHGFDSGCDTEAVLLLSDIEAVLAQVAALTGAQQTSAWVTLPGTLPEPGKPVLLDIGEEYPIRAMWAAKHTLEVGLEDDSGFGEYNENTDEWYCPEGWYEWNEHEDVHWHVDKTPVAWCELPHTAHTSSGKGE